MRKVGVRSGHVFPRQEGDNEGKQKTYLNIVNAEVDDLQQRRVVVVLPVNLRAAGATAAAEVSMRSLGAGPSCTLGGQKKIESAHTFEVWKLMESFIREVIASLCLFAANLVICPVTFIIVPSCPSLGAAARGPTRKETGPQAWSPAVPTPVRRGSTTGVLCSQAWFSFNKIHSSNSSSFSPYFDLVFDLLVSPAMPKKKGKEPTPKPRATRLGLAHGPVRPSKPPRRHLLDGSCRGSADS